LTRKKNKAVTARHRGLSADRQAQRHKGTEGEGLSGTIIEDALGTPGYDEVGVHDTSSEPNFTGVVRPE